MIGRHELAGRAGRTARLDSDDARLLETANAQVTALRDQVTALQASLRKSREDAAAGKTPECPTPEELGPVVVSAPAHVHSLDEEEGAIAAELARFNEEEARLTRSYAKYANVLHVVSHTHWDREWYLPFEKYRRRFVWIMDDVFYQMKKHADVFRHFHMDGQVIPFLDYLEVRPTMRDKVLRAIRERKMSIGPWYTAPDEFLASGEAITRNLLNGFRHTFRMGVEPELIGYMADQFGHISQMPQIYHLFGIDNAVFARGLQSSSKAESLWRSPDGSEIFVVYMSKWYCNAEGSPAGASAAGPWFKRKSDEIGRVSTTKHRLLMAGCDHTAMDPNVLPNLREINRKKSIANSLLVHSNLRHYLTVVRDELVASRKSGGLAVAKGELRTQIAGLSHIASNKITQKQANWLCQTLLEHYAEPLRAMLWAHGALAEYHLNYLWYAWEKILQNHAHDSIGGCSVPDVHVDVDHRNTQCRQVAQSLLDEALMRLAKSVSGARGGDTNVVVANTLNFERTDTAMVLMQHAENLKGLVTVKDVTTGEEVTGEVLEDRKGVWDFFLPDHGFRKPFSASKKYVAFPATVPPMGVKTYTISPKAGSTTPAEGPVLQNAKMEVTVEKDGTVTIKDKASSRSYPSLNTLVVVRDRGDEYRFSGGGSEAKLTAVKVGKVNAGPAGSRVAVTGELKMPDDTSAMKVSVVYFLPTDSNTLNIRTSIKNHHKHFRMRARFPIPKGKGARAVFVDGHYDLVNRNRAGGSEALPQQDFVHVCYDDVALTVSNRGLPEYNFEGESLAVTLIRATGRMGDWGVFPTAPSSYEHGVQSFEYAVSPGLGRAAESDDDAASDHVDSMQDGRAFNVPLATAQLLNYPGVMSSHPIFDLRMSALRLVEKQLLGSDAPTVSEFKPDRSDLGGGGRGSFVASYRGPKKPIIESGTSFLDLRPARSLVLSAVKKAESRDVYKEDHDSVIVRFYSIRSKTVEGTLKADFAVKEAWLVNLAEKRLKQLTPDAQGVYHFTVKAKKIITVELVPQR